MLSVACSVPICHEINQNWLAKTVLLNGNIVWTFLIGDMILQFK